MPYSKQIVTIPTKPAVDTRIFREMVYFKLMKKSNYDKKLFRVRTKFRRPVFTCSLVSIQPRLKFKAGTLQIFSFSPKNKIGNHLYNGVLLKNAL